MPVPVKPYCVTITKSPEFSRLVEQLLDSAYIFASMTSPRVTEFEQIITSYYPRFFVFDGSIKIEPFLMILESLKSHYKNDPVVCIVSPEKHNYSKIAWVESPFELKEFYQHMT